MESGELERANLTASTAAKAAIVAVVAAAVVDPYMADLYTMDHGVVRQVLH